MTRQPANVDLEVYSGATFQQDFIWGCGESIEITSIIIGAVTTVIAPRHGLQTGQVVTVSGIKGTKELNGGTYTIIAVDANSFTLDGVDSTAYGLYLSGGYVVIPVDITGYTAIMHIRSKQPSDEVILELSTANNRIILGGTNGAIELEIDSTDTAALKKGKYVYDLKLISAGSVTTRFIQGKISIDSQVTR